MLRVLWRFLFPQQPIKHFQTVRYAFPLVVITALFASLATVITENKSYVTIRSSTETVVKDQQFFIDVSITAHVPINAIDLVIRYPEENIDIENIDTGTSVITLWTEEPYARSGEIYLRGGTFRKGFVGEHTIARVRARAKDTGEARIVLEDTQLVAGDGKGTEILAIEDPNYNETVINVTASEDGTVSAEASIVVVTDVDGDGDVDLADVSTFMSAWLTRNKLFDFNGDGKMTFRDFSILLAESFFK